MRRPYRRHRKPFWLPFIAWCAAPFVLMGLIVGCTEPPPPTTQVVTPAPSQSSPPPPSKPTELDKIEAENQTPDDDTSTSNTPTPPTADNSTSSNDSGDHECPYVGPWNDQDRSQDSAEGGWDGGCNTKTFRVEEVFDIDHCRVYRFFDAGEWRYFQDCHGGDQFR